MGILIYLTYFDKRTFFWYNLESLNYILEFGNDGWLSLLDRTLFMLRNFFIVLAKQSDSTLSFYNFAMAKRDNHLPINPFFTNKTRTFTLKMLRNIEIPPMSTFTREKETKF